MATNNWPHMPGRDFVQQVGTEGDNQETIKGLSFLRMYPRLTMRQGGDMTETMGWRGEGV